jgi:hypothetical protein
MIGLRFVITAFGLWLIAPQAATATTTVATCKLGGCQCSLSPLAAEDISFVWGFETPAIAPTDLSSATLVVDLDHDAVYWTDASRQSIDRAYQGDGNCPIELFADDAVIPRDGTWRWQVTGTSIGGCPPMLAAALGTNLPDSHMVRVDWGGRFDPALLATSPEMSVYRWRDTGGNSAASEPLGGRDCDAGTCSSVWVRLWMTLITPETIRGHMVLKTRADPPDPAGANVLAAFGIGACDVVVGYRIDHIAD